MNESETRDEEDEIGIVNTEQRVQEALTGSDTVADEVTITSLQSDIVEREAVSNFMCGCSKVNKQPCSRQSSPGYVASMRESCAELCHGELDMAIMGQVMAGMNTSSSVSTTIRRVIVRKFTPPSITRESLCVS